MAEPSFEAVPFIPTREELRQFGPPQIEAINGVGTSLREQTAVSEAYHRAKNAVLIPFVLRQAGQIAQLDYEATHNPVSGLPNERGFYRNIERMREIDPDVVLALVASDLDGFKDLNDIYGHHRGDEGLRQVAGKFRRGDTEGEVANPHGDEFLVAAPYQPRRGSNLTPEEHAAALEDRTTQIGEELRESDADLQAVNFSMSAAGVVVRPGDDLQERVRVADELVAGKKRLRRQEIHQQRRAAYDAETLTFGDDMAAQIQSSGMTPEQFARDFLGFAGRWVDVD